MRITYEKLYHELGDTEGSFIEVCRNPLLDQQNEINLMYSQTKM